MSGQVPEGSGEQGTMEETGCEIICDAPTTLAVKELMMMMIFHYIVSIEISVLLCVESRYPMHIHQLWNLSIHRTIL